MNSLERKLFRLLKLFPVNRIRDIFDTTGRVQNELINSIIQNRPQEQIFDFAKSNFGYTKKHVYILSNGEINQRDVPQELINSLNPIEDVSINDQRELFYFTPVIYKAFLSDPLERVQIEFNFLSKLLLEMTIS